MTIEFIVTDNDGTVLTQAKEEVMPNFSMHDFLNKTVPGWEATVKAFFNQEETNFHHAFGGKEQTSATNEGMPEDPKQTNAGTQRASATGDQNTDTQERDPEGDRIRAEQQGTN